VLKFITEVDNTTAMGALNPATLFVAFLAGGAIIGAVGVVWYARDGDYWQSLLSVFLVFWTGSGALRWGGGVELAAPALVAGQILAPLLFAALVWGDRFVDGRLAEAVNSYPK
jgi:hypothetical protein